MSEVFNPLEHLAVQTDKADNPQWEYLEQNGLPVHKIGPDGLLHNVLVAKRYLPVMGYRQWFYSKYPEGSIIVDDITPEAALVSDHFVDYPSYKIKVTLYADQEHTKTISTGYGSYRKADKYDPSKEKHTYVEKSESMDNFHLCQAIALKDAMANAGFIYDYNADVINATDAQFVEMDFAKLKEEPATIIPVDAEVPGISSEPEAAESAVKEEKAKVKIMTKEEVEAFVGPKAVEETKTKEETTKVSVKKSSVPTMEEDPVGAFLSQKEEDSEEAEEKETLSLKGEMAKHSQPDPLEEQGLTESEEKSEENSDYIPEEVIFSLAEGVEVTPLMEPFVGKKIGEIDPAKIKYFAKKSNLDKTLSKETIAAIVAVA